MMIAMSAELEGKFVAENAGGHGEQENRRSTTMGVNTSRLNPFAATNVQNATIQVRSIKPEAVRAIAEHEAHRPSIPEYRREIQQSPCAGFGLTGLNSRQTDSIKAADGRHEEGGPPVPCLRDKLKPETTCPPQMKSWRCRA